MTRTDTVRAGYRAFAAGDRATVEDIIAPELVFSSPANVGLDRAGYFERCWPAAGAHQEFDFVRASKLGMRSS